MKKLPLSIIVPVYNAEKYLRACIESIQKQTLTAWELLLINDGSTDNSGKICDEYAQRDERIHAVHKENGGVSSARNVGLSLAKGEFIGFVDADDTILPQMYERMYSVAQAEQADVVLCDAVSVDTEGNEELDSIAQLSNSCTLEKACITPDLLKEMAGSSWRCIYANALIQRHEEFPVAQKFSEDRVFNIYMMGYATRIAYIKEPFYRRYLWEESAVHRFHADYFEAVKYAAAGTRVALAAAWDNAEAYQTAYLEQFIVGSFAAINNYFYKTSTLTKRERKAAVKALCNDEELQTALKKYPCTDIRVKWIAKKRINLLCLLAKILNKKYGR